MKQPKNEFGLGDTCSWKDAEGNLIIRQVIQKDGLHFIRPDKEVWILRPDKEGADKGIWIYKGKTTLAKALAGDDGEKGFTRLLIEYYTGNRKTGSWADTFAYDPFTGNRR